MNWRELDDKIDDYVIGRRWSEEKYLKVNTKRYEGYRIYKSLNKITI